MGQDGRNTFSRIDIVSTARIIDPKHASKSLPEHDNELFFSKNKLNKYIYIYIYIIKIK